MGFIKKVSAYILILSLFSSLSGCMGYLSESTPKESEIIFFESDSKINDLIVRYNSISSTDFSKESISKGNVRNKAHISHNGLYITIVNSDFNGFIDIRIEGSPSQKDLLFSVFRIFLLSLNDKLTVTDINTAWNHIQANTCRVDYYKDVGDQIYSVGGVQLGYFNATDAFPDIKIDMLYRYK